jgi:hypothetical protein
MDLIQQKAACAAILAALVCADICTATAAWAKQPATAVAASMVQPPQPPASGANASNPDNMPIKRPQKATRDPIARRPPASSAQPK